MSDKPNRCEGRYRGFCGGQCESAGSVERDGKWYCKRHDPAPAAVPPGEPQYVYEVWCNSMLSEPTVKRYRLVKRNAKGGPTVLMRGHQKVLAIASDKRFFYDLDKLREWLRTWLANELAAVERRRDKLSARWQETAAGNDPDSGFPIEHVRDDCPQPKNFKT